MAAGIHYFGPRIFRAKTTSTIDTLENTVRAVISWSEANNRQLASSANFPHIVPDPTDPYGQPLYYVYDNNLTSLTSGGLCGRSFTSLTVNFCPTAACASPSTQINNVAFVILSSGADLRVETMLTGTFNGIGGFNGPIPYSSNAIGNINIYASGVTIPTIGNYPYDDITRVVTLNELKSRAHCAGVTRGRLMLLNNELPRACANSPYAAIVYPDGGVPNSGSYNWCSNWTNGTPGSITVNPSTVCTGSTSSTSWSSGFPTLSLSGNTAGTGNYPITVMLEDSDTTPNFVQRNYVLSVVDCGTGNNSISGPGGGGGGGTTTQINTGGSNASNSAATNQLSQNIVTNVSGANNSVISAQNNVLTFGYNVGNGEACVWFPGNFPLLGKIMRAFWNFCFRDIETPYPAGNTSAACNTCPNCTSCPWCSSSCGGCNACSNCTTTNACPACTAANAATSQCFADGYTFTLMQAYNPTTYCGTGTAYDVNLNPFYNCSDVAPPTYTGAGHLGEFMSYCGLPGYSMAVEFDIYPNNGANSRNDPANNYNHAAIVHSINNHNFGTTPSCNGYCNGTCTGTCNGVTGYNAACGGECWGTCSGTCDTNALSLYADNTHNLGGNPACTSANSGSSGCLYGAPNDINAVTNSAVTWMEDGCSPGYTTHNARVEVHSRCSTNNYTSCDNTAYCSTSSYDCMEVWIDKGNSNLNSNAGTVPDVYYCFQHPTAMNQVKIGFTEGTGASEQIGYIANFSASVEHACNLPAISMASSVLRTSSTCNGTTAPSCSSTPCLCLTSGQLLAAQFTASGGTGSYTWTLGAANITGIAASNLPSWLSLQTSGNCGSYNNCTNSSPCLCGNAPANAAIYNTILAALNDGCVSDCSNGYNTSSQSYVINVACSGYQVWNTTGHHYDFQVSGAACNPAVSNGSEITNGTPQLTVGGTVTRYAHGSGCSGGSLGQITYTDALNADSTSNGGNGNCQVNYNADNVGTAGYYGSSDTASDR